MVTHVSWHKHDAFSKVQELEVTKVEKHSVKTPTESSEAPSNGLRNFITNAASVIKLVVTNLAKKPAENTVEEEDNENNTVLDFSSGTAQETESTGE